MCGEGGGSEALVPIPQSLLLHMLASFAHLCVSECRSRRSFGLRIKFVTEATKGIGRAIRVAVVARGVVRLSVVGEQELKLSTAARNEICEKAERMILIFRVHAESSLQGSSFHASIDANPNGRVHVSILLLPATQGSVLAASHSNNHLSLRRRMPSSFSTYGTGQVEAPSLFLRPS